MLVTIFVPPAILRGMTVVWTREEVFGLVRDLVLDKTGYLNRLKVKAILFAVSKWTGERGSESNLNNTQKNGSRFCTYSAALKTISYLTNYMRQNPSWEADRFSASQEISRIVWNPEIQYRIYKSPQPVPILTQENPVHAPRPSESHSNIILPSMPGSSKWSVSLRILHHHPACTFPLPHTCYLPRPCLSS
jgi:hypothetical protein